jgi:hypothetical protein
VQSYNTDRIEIWQLKIIGVGDKELYSMQIMQIERVYTDYSV